MTRSGEGVFYSACVKMRITGKVRAGLIGYSEDKIRQLAAHIAGIMQLSDHQLLRMRRSELEYLGVDRVVLNDQNYRLVILAPGCSSGRLGCCGACGGGRGRTPLPFSARLCLPLARAPACARYQWQGRARIGVAAVIVPCCVRDSG